MAMMYQYGVHDWGRTVLGGLWGVSIASVVFLLVVWSLVWKGMALWKAARHGSKGWFVALLIINTVGILDILYLYVFSKKSSAVHG